MATAACATVSGVRLSCYPIKVAVADCATVAGVNSATSRVAWGGSAAKRSRVNWIPGAHVPVLDAAGRMSQPWYRFFQEIAENRLGGIEAATLPQVVTVQAQTQTQVIDVQAGVTSVGQQVSAVTDVVNTATQVAVDSGLSGATQIPVLPSYKLGQLGISNQ